MAHAVHTVLAAPRAGMSGSGCLRLGPPVGTALRRQRQQRGGLAVWDWVWGGTVVSTWVT
jgi:hypothetical protein